MFNIFTPYDPVAYRLGINYFKCENHSYGQKSQIIQSQYTIPIIASYDRLEFQKTRRCQILFWPLIICLTAWKTLNIVVLMASFLLLIWYSFIRSKMKLSTLFKSNISNFFCYKIFAVFRPADFKKQIFFDWLLFNNYLNFNVDFIEWLCGHFSDDRKGESSSPSLGFPTSNPIRLALLQIALRPRFLLHTPRFGTFYFGYIENANTNKSINIKI